MQQPINILVVDDEREIADLLQVYLQNENYNVFTCYTAQEAIQVFETVKLDLAILDVMLPDMDGFTICQKIRENHHFPIIMLTAKDGVIDRITGLTLGADDYLIKPFRPLELIARVKAQLRRFTTYNNKEMVPDENILSFSGLVINRHAHECTLNERPLSLTPTEFSILWVLCKNRGQVVSSERLFREVWGDNGTKPHPRCFHGLSSFHLELKIIVRVSSDFYQTELKNASRHVLSLSLAAVMGRKKQRKLANVLDVSVHYPPALHRCRQRTCKSNQSGLAACGEQRRSLYDGCPCLNDCLNPLPHFRL